MTDVAPDADEAEGRSGGRPVHRPPALVVGVGAVRGVTAAEVGALIDAALAGHDPGSVRVVAAKAGEPGIVAAARERGWPVVSYPAEILAGVAVPNPSELVRGHAGTPSVAEASALHAARMYGRGGELIVPKIKSGRVTVAVARLVPHAVRVPGAAR
ncbi:cobalamin biosynthesis protein [Actinomadura macrotermitis]|uniref:Cobalt-precorrin-5A hydrolase n=1 Tax=Actinomadura macrotermitis TaxID=2585200 RepID=A0A7K0BYX0_9ACTN|nr:cobalamin biosynthesis protein [Actinomadura macrotermitis]MQY06380.1 Cobalt-precorrin-5A hydrolase [Actinomadura macrotermitis]